MLAETGDRTLRVGRVLDDPRASYFSSDSAETLRVGAVHESLPGCETCLPDVLRSGGASWCADLRREGAAAETLRTAGLASTATPGAGTRSYEPANTTGAAIRNAADLSP
jgi:hypothetical protein